MKTLLSTFMVMFLFFSNQLLASSNINLCEYFPSSLQNNNYYLGNPLPGSVSATGNNAKLFLPNYDPLSYSLVTFSGRDSGCIYDGITTEKCLFDRTVTYPNFPPKLPSFQTGNTDFLCANGRQCSISPGRYDDVEIGNNATVTFAAGEYWISELELLNGAKIVTNEQVFIHYRELDVQGNGVKLNAEGYYENLVLIGHGVSSRFQTAKNNLTMKALWYVESISGISFQNNGFDFEGSISASQILLSSNNHIIHAKPPTQCTQPDGRYELTITPPIDSALVCGADYPTFTINTKKDGEFSAQDVTVELYKKSPGDARYLKARVVDGIGTGSGKNFRTNTSGKLKLEIYSNDVDKTEVNTKYIIKVRLVKDPRETQSRNFQFYALVFSIDNVEAIAGKPVNVRATAYGCAEDLKPVVINYFGEPTVSYELVTPSLDIGGLKGKLDYQPVFEKGTSDDLLTMSEAGKFVVTLVDDKFDCEGLSHCSGTGRLSGEFEVKSRPWTYAICDSAIQPFPSGNIEDKNSAAYAPAGTGFDVRVLPIRWSDSATNYCSDSLVTNNFFLDIGEAIPINLLHQAVLPATENGVLTGATTKQYTDKAATGNYYDFGVLKWSEVGTLELKASSGNHTYLGMKIDDGTAPIGRFYPSYFAIDQSDWAAPPEQGDVTYLSQPFDKVEIGVAALNVDGNKVKNYHHFVPDLQAKFAVKQDSKVDNELRIDETGHWQANTDGTSVWKLADDNAAVMRHEVKNTGSVITTQANGPFNLGGETTDYGLTISGVDPVSFDADSQQTEENFASQPKVQYGRMVMGSLGGVSGSKFTIPLRIEYWDGNRFALNTFDDRTALTDDAEYLCKQTIWPTTGSSSDSKLVLDSGANKVVDGVSTGLEAWAADNVRREQVRFWMQLDDMSDLSHSSPHLSRVTGCGTKGLDQPWLQYNWQGEGDEDPSTVVTFGIYRGSDKIIFRGESGLTGQ